MPGSFAWIRCFQRSWQQNRAVAVGQLSDDAPGSALAMREAWQPGDARGACCKPSRVNRSQQQTAAQPRHSISQRLIATSSGPGSA